MIDVVSSDWVEFRGGESRTSATELFDLRFPKKEGEWANKAIYNMKSIYVECGQSMNTRSLLYSP